MTTMNKSAFVREATTTVANHISITGKTIMEDEFYGPVTEEDKKEIAELLEKMFDILNKDGYYMGRRGVKY